MSLQEETKQRFTVHVPFSDSMLNVGDTYAGKGTYMSHVTFGYPGYSLRTLHHFTHATGDMVTQAMGAAKIQSGGHFRLYASGDSIYSSADKTMLSAANDVVIASGAGQGALPISLSALHEAPTVDRYNPLDLWQQVQQHNIDLQWFLGIDDDWVTLAKDAAKVPAPKALPKWGIFTKKVNQQQGGGIEETDGWFSKTAAQTGYRLGVSMRNQSQDLRGTHPEKKGFKDLWKTDRRLIPIFPHGIAKDSEHYPMVTDFDPYAGNPTFVRVILAIRDLANRLIGVVADNTIVNGLKVIVSAAGAVVACYNGVLDVMDQITGAQDRLLGPLTAFLDNKIMKGIAGPFMAIERGINAGSGTGGEKASVTSASETYDLSRTETLHITCEGHAPEVTLDPSTVPMYPARLVLSVTMTGRRGPEALHVTVNGATTTAVLKVSRGGSELTATKIQEGFTTNAPAGLTVTESEGKVVLQTTGLGSDKYITVRALSDEEWTADVNSSGAAGDGAASYLALTNTTGTAAAQTQWGSNGPSDIAAVTAAELKTILDSAGTAHYTTTVVGTTVKVESNHTAIVGQPSEITISTDALAGRTGLSGAHDIKENERWVEGGHDVDQAAWMGERAMATVDGVDGVLDRVVRRGIDDLVQEVDKFCSCITDPARSVLGIYEQVTDLLGSNASNKVGIFGGEGITMATGGAMFSHAREGFCFVASGAEGDELNWAWDKWQGAFRSAYQLLRFAEKGANFGKLYGSSNFYGGRNLGFRVRAQHDVDLITGNVATLAAIGPGGLGRLLAGDAAEVTAMNKIAIAARAESSSVEVLGEGIFIGAANKEAKLKLGQFRYATQKHDAYKERTVGDAEKRGDLDLQSLKKTEEAAIKKDGELKPVFAWANDEGKQPDDFTPQAPTKQVGIAAKEAAWMHVGKWVLCVSNSNIEIFQNNAEPDNTVGAPGQLYTRPALAGVLGEDQPKILVNENAIQLGLNSKSGAVGLTLHKENGVSLVGCGWNLTLGDNGLVFENADKKGMEVTSTGIFIKDGNTSLPVFDKKAVLKEIEVTTTPVMSKLNEGLDRVDKQTQSIQEDLDRIELERQQQVDDNVECGAVIDEEKVALLEVLRSCFNRE